MNDCSGNAEGGIGKIKPQGIRGLSQGVRRESKDNQSKEVGRRYQQTHSISNIETRMGKILPRTANLTRGRGNDIAKADERGKKRR